MSKLTKEQKRLFIEALNKLESIMEQQTTTLITYTNIRLELSKCACYGRFD